VIGRPALPPLGPVLEFMRLVWAVDHGLQAASKRMEAAIGVTGPQRLVIRLLGRFPGMNASQLAEALRVHPSTVTGILKRLEQRRLVARRPDPRDRRRTFLGLAARGRALDVAVSGTIESAVREVLGGLPAERVDVVREVLSALAEALGRTSGGGAPGEAAGAPDRAPRAGGARGRSAPRGLP
jgi:DNA-binding MarR family transcriptional regulator